MECSEKIEKEDIEKHPDFLSVTGLIAFTCVDVLAINISLQIVVRPSERKKEKTPHSMETSSILVLTCNCSHADAV